MPRGWWLGLAAGLGAAGAVLVALGRRRAREEAAKAEAQLAQARPDRSLGQPIIHVCGRSRVGKSAVVAALLAADGLPNPGGAGITAPWRDGAALCELPGFALDRRYLLALADQFMPGDLLVLVVRWPVSDSERDWLRAVRQQFPEVRPLAMVTACDLWRARLTAEQRRHRRREAWYRLSRLLEEPADLVYGEAGAAGPPEIGDLRDRLLTVLGGA